MIPINEITWDKVINLKYFILLDVRNNPINKLPNSIQVEYELLLNNPNNYINKEKEYYIFCDYGVKSTKISIILNKLGYKTYSIIGGYNAYTKL